MAHNARWHKDNGPRGGGRGRLQGKGAEAGAGAGGPRRWNTHSNEEDTSYPAHNGRKRLWEADEEHADYADAEQEQALQAAPVPVRKRKRGGKGAREKELKWKLAHGLADTPELPAAPEATNAPADGALADSVSTEAEKTKSTQGLETRVEKANTAKAAKVKPSKLAGLPTWIAYPLTVPDTISSTPESAVPNPQWGLSPRVIARLAAKNITHLFPVQTAVLPRLLQTRYSSASVPPGDLCVSAPTGSGKTLAYALPIVEALGRRVVPRVRALIVLPTRDLAAQVKVTFDMLVRGTDVKAVLITGQTTFSTEQAQLVAPEGGGHKWDVLTEADGSSLADIVIATPGRLIDHLKGTKGFTLRHLRFLVIDEADRLLNQSYQDWLQHVLNAADPIPDTANAPAAASSPQCEQSWAQLGFAVDSLGLPIHRVASYRHGASATATTSITDPCVRHYTPLQKLLFSATLTRNPAKIASLHLYNPTYVAVVGSDGNPSAENSLPAAAAGEDARYTAPSTLEERMIVCASAGDKPLSLLHILYNLEPSGGGVLVFTKSVEAAHRLAALIQIFDRARKGLAEPDSSSSQSSSDSDSDHGEDADDTGSKGGAVTAPAPSFPAQAFSSDLTPVQRRRLLTSFRSGRIRALVCSDVMARGMDLGESVAHVVNYDLPSRTKTYVHRVGRTARAGRQGVAWTILEAREARWFKQEVVRKVERAGDKAVARVKVTADSVKSLVEGYQHALKELAGLVHKADGVAVGDAKAKKSATANTTAAQKKQDDTETSSDGSSSDSSESGSDESDGSDHSVKSSSSSPSASDSDSDDEDADPVQALLPSSAFATSASNANTRRLEAALAQAASLVAPPRTRMPLAGGREWWYEDE
ncbi:ATP-dependent RNA helicase dbp6 [Geranomyces variabilis]|nr:ATP-dependent RNA helicase dbp6 [Geranomyces variabilis]